MQNWDPLQPTNYEQNWYSNMFHHTIKQEAQSTQPPPNSVSNHLEHYINMKQQELSSVMTPSPRASDSNINPGGMIPTDVNAQHYFENTSAMLQQHHPLGFNPLTPPGLPNAVLPSMAHFYQNPQPTNVGGGNGLMNPVETAPKLDQQSNTALTPRNTPPMDVTPPKSPKTSIMSTSSEIDQDLMSSNSSEDMKFLESEDDESIRLPIYNSHGKMKNYKCKTCGYLAITKVAFWDHARSHMKPEKTLQCSKCPFVTELKHHLEYHIRKHKNLKPFQCDKCSYSCVNKSMLNSHRKSHSSVYQYRCSDCDYATKYCHSFKLHLRKYDHKPGMVLDEDGAPNPSVVIDVYGTRRGPKTKSGRKDSSGANKMPQLNAALQGFNLNQHNNHHNMPASPARSTTSSSSEMVQSMQANPQPQRTQQEQIQQQHQQHQQQLSNLLPLSAIFQQRNLSLFPYWNLNLQMLAAQQQAVVFAQLSPRFRETALQNMQKKYNENKEESYIDDEEEEDLDESYEATAMDLSAATPTKNAQVAKEIIMNLKIKEQTQQDTPIISSSNQVRRKGRVLKLEQNKESPEGKPAASPPQTELPTSSSFDDTTKETKGSKPNEVPSATKNNSSPNPTPITTTTTTSASEVFYECKYCDILFRDPVLYTIHMGYHSCDDVFKCNMCGEKCGGPVGLFVHMARNAHA